MPLSNRNIQIILKTLIPKFHAYIYIDKDFIQDTLYSFLDDSLNVNEEPYIIEQQEYQIAPRLYVATKVENYIYYIIVQAALVDSKMMAILLEDKQQLVQSLCQKYTIINFKSFFRETLSQYDAHIPLDSFLEEQAKLIFTSSSLSPSPNSSLPKKESSPKESIANANPYALCCSIVGEKLGSGTYDDFIQLGRRLNILNIINSDDNIPYEMYLLLRFGYINGSIFTKKEIAYLTKQSILDIIQYEKKTIQLLRDSLDKQFNNYEEYLLKK